MSVQLSRGRSLPLTSVSSSQLNKTSSLSSSHLRGKKIELQKLDEGNSAFHTAILVKSKQKRKETAKGKTSAFEFDPVFEVFENSKIMEVMQQFLMPCEVSDVAQLTREIHSSVDRTVDNILNELDSVLPSTGIEVPVGLTPLKRLEYILKSLCEFTGVDPKEIIKNIEIPVQGGLDPKVLLTDKDNVKKNTIKYMEIFKDHPYIFNLGHGVLPETNPDMVKYLVNTVKDFK